MNFKELLEKKRAEAAAKEAATKQAAPAAIVETVKEVAAEHNVVAAAISPLAVEEAPAAPAKPLTLAERLALKKKDIQKAQTAPPPPAPAPKAAEIDPSMIPEDPVDAQAYVDIKNKIEALDSYNDDDLRSAMSELKAALKKNPNAALLMLDADVGKMVTALRRMTHVAQVEATQGKKPGRKTTPKAKDIILTPEQIEAAMAEL